MATPNLSTVIDASFAAAVAVAVAAFLPAPFDIDERFLVALLGTMVAAAEAGGPGEDKNEEGDGIRISMRADSTRVCVFVCAVEKSYKVYIVEYVALGRECTSF